MELLDHLFNDSIAELSSLELILGGVLIAALAITFAFVLYRLTCRAIQDGTNVGIEEWYRSGWRKQDE